MANCKKSPNDNAEKKTPLTITALQRERESEEEGERLGEFVASLDLLFQILLRISFAAFGLFYKISVSSSRGLRPAYEVRNSLNAASLRFRRLCNRRFRMSIVC